MIYSQLYLYFDGQLIAENVSLDIATQGESEGFIDMRDGYLGVIASPKLRRISGTVAVSIEGLEYPFEWKLLNHIRCGCVVQFAGTGEDMSTEGYFTSFQSSGGVGKNVSVSFTFVGRPIV